MKQYRITSADFVNENSEIPDAVLPDENREVVQTIMPKTIGEYILSQYQLQNKSDE